MNRLRGPGREGPISKAARPLAALLLVFGAVPVLGQSTPVAGPGSYNVGATSVAIEPALAGTVLADRTQPFSIVGAAGGLATGSVEERVVRSDLTGFLDFYHRLTLDTIAGFAPGSYVEYLEFDPVATGTPLGVGRRTDTFGTATSTLYDLAASNQSRFDFNLIDLSPANAGFTTQLHFWTTSATGFALTGQLRVTGAEFIDFDAQGLATPYLATYAPAAVPEPGAWSLLILGFAAIGAVARYRRSSRRLVVG